MVKVQNILFFLPLALLGLFFPFVLRAESLPVAQIMIQSHRGTINIEAGKAFTFQVGFKNVGENTWLDHGSEGVALRSLGPSPFYHEYWLNITEPTKMDIPSAAPGEIGFFKFSIQVPRESGLYVAQFQLVQGDAIWVKNGSISIPIQVVSSASTSEVLSEKTAVATTDTSLQMVQPNIRVGLYETKDPIIISSKTSYDIYDLNRSLLFSAVANQDTTILFDPVTKAYTLDVAGKKKATSGGIRFESMSAVPVFEIESYENRPSWNTSLNDNLFWGTLEIQYNSQYDRSWMINELPMEKYLEGLAESSNSSPDEFQKALAIAARTYATYHFLNPGKHIMFTVDSQYDQVYRGYNLSQRMDKWVKNVQASQGQVVTYENSVVITPYFSQSDGRTRAWTEVWGGESKSWLISVDDPWNKEKTLLGHGVGLSAQGAIGFAQEDKYSYEQILKHYYTGAEIKKVY